MTDQLTEPRRALIQQGTCGVRQWQTIGLPGELGPRPSATGSADLTGCRCLVKQQSYPPARAQATRAAQRQAGPIKKLFLVAADAAFGAVGTKFVLRYYDRADSFTQTEPGRPWKRDSGKSGQLRRRMDPTVILDLLDGLVQAGTEEHTRIQGVPDPGCREVEGHIDLLSLAPRLDSVFAEAITQEPADHWVAAAPVRGWIDDHGRLIRASWAPLPHPSENEPLWLTTEFHDYGQRFDPPADFART